MRIKNSLRNAIVAWGSQAIHIFVQFIARTYIIMILSIEYIGLNGLFSNILMVLSLAELGIGDAIIYSLYKPIAEDDKQSISAIMRFYKKVYCMIGIVILTIGSFLAPFLSLLIKDTPNIPNLQFIYLLFVFNSAVSYFFSYKAAFLNAKQNNYIVLMNTSLFESGMVICQIIFLKLTKRYELFLLIGIFFVFLQNVNITRIVNKKYPFLSNNEIAGLNKSTFQSIIKNTSALVLHKIGMIVVFATDNLIISKFVGLVATGIFSNYTLITDSVYKIVSTAFNAIASSVGNLVVSESKEKQRKIFFDVMFINFWMSVFINTCFVNLLNPFIYLWLGKAYLLPINSVFVLALKVYITCMRLSVTVFKNAMGLYWNNKFMPIAESVINLIVSILLVDKYGINGVMIGTIISSISTCMWIEPLILFRDGFGENLISYFRKYLMYFVAFIGICLATVLANSIIFDHLMIDFILHMILTIGISNILIIIIFCKTREFIHVHELILSIKYKSNK